MGKVSKGIKCSAESCVNPAVRSVPIDQAREAGIRTSSTQRRIYLCESHYKALKKARRKEERLERWRWASQG
ncbi:MAG: hypothetical protein JTT11_09990 [Candidatus Brockarchaeota archaeon]|nr:hypothetical protein [Candidatus Brockarchaeota archaeon]